MNEFDAIADPIRRQILERLNRSELSAGQIAAAYDLSRPAISRHLRVLRESGLVSVREEGRHHLYSIDRGGVAVLHRWLEQFHDQWTPRLDALETEIYRTRRQRDYQRVDHQEEDQLA